MELTLRQALKSRKVRNINGYYPYEHLVNTVASIYKQINALDESLLTILDREIKVIETGSSLLKYESYDYLLVSAISRPLLFPVFLVQENLCQSLYNTSCKNEIIISCPFIDSGIILMPKLLNGRHPEVAIYIFAVARHSDGVRAIFVSSISPIIGLRGVQVIFLDKPNEDLELNKTDFLFNLFLYQESIKDKEPISTELLIPQSRGFGTAKNTNQKQIITPRMIGADYKPKTIRQESTGTHASPTTHWRSGHWRQQLIGKRETPEHKTIWIEPVLVNG